MGDVVGWAYVPIRTYVRMCVHVQHDTYVCSYVCECVRGRTYHANICSGQPAQGIAATNERTFGRGPLWKCQGGGMRDIKFRNLKPKIAQCLPVLLLRAGGSSWGSQWVSSLEVETLHPWVFAPGPEAQRRRRRRYRWRSMKVLTGFRPRYVSYC